MQSQLSVKPGLGHWQTVQNVASDQGFHCLLELQEVYVLIKQA